LSGLKSSTSPRKTYHRPTCTLKSITEVAALLRKNTSDQENTSKTHDSASVDMPILLVEGYEGDLSLIMQTTSTLARQLEPFSILKGGLVEMQFAHNQNANSPATFLLLDLRHRGHGEPGLFESIGWNPNLSDAIPSVILVSSMEHFHGWRGIAPAHCWKLGSGPSSVDLVVALRAFSHLCAVLAKPSPDKKSAVAKTNNHALIGKPGKE
jgi:hypothetical protein